MKETTFLDKCKGITMIFASFSLILFGIATLVYSASPAVANGPTQTYSTGKYMMSLQAVVGSDGKEMNWYILVWDTENGRSKMYYGNGGNLKKIIAAGSAYNLPSSPL